MPPYHLFTNTTKNDFLQLGFITLCDSPEHDSREHYFELKIDDVLIRIDTWGAVTAIIEEKGFSITLIADNIDELKDWIEFITLMNK
ncbi:hypothetical protein [Aureispira sp. CCB-QB1]|uniref:hypothetical protein n=1 Tax=Aureispira sp. CCB-QB1 TaxID=1313421 RepID=UPI000697DA82|nr:hypothetical protein [Aureispira sp. CCB-QB1]